MLGEITIFWAYTTKVINSMDWACSTVQFFSRHNVWSSTPCLILDMAMRSRQVVLSLYIAQQRVELTQQGGKLAQQSVLLASSNFPVHHFDFLGSSTTC